MNEHKEVYPDVQIGKKPNGEALYARELLDENERLRKTTYVADFETAQAYIEQLQADKAAAIKTLEFFANIEWHPNADYVPVEMLYEVKFHSRTTLSRIKGEAWPPMPTGTERISKEEAETFHSTALERLEGGTHE